MPRLPWRRSVVPAALRDRVDVGVGVGAGAAAGERILGWAWIGTDGWAVATDRAFRASVAAVGSTDETPLVIPWGRVARARWSDGALEIMGSVPGGSMQRYVFAVTSGGRLAEAVQIAVTDSMLWEQRIEDADGRGAHVVGRRGTDGEVDWTVSFDRGVDPADPRVRQWADAQVAEIRGLTGL